MSKIITVKVKVLSHVTHEELIDAITTNEGVLMCIANEFDDSLKDGCAVTVWKSPEYKEICEAEDAGYYGGKSNSVMAPWKPEDIF